MHTAPNCAHTFTYLRTQSVNTLHQRLQSVDTASLYSLLLGDPSRTVFSHSMWLNETETSGSRFILPRTQFYKHHRTVRPWQTRTERRRKKLVRNQHRPPTRNHPSKFKQQALGVGWVSGNGSWCRGSTDWHWLLSGWGSTFHRGAWSKLETNALKNSVASYWLALEKFMR